MMKREDKLKGILIFSFVIGIFLTGLVSAGLIGWIKTITGRATSQYFDINITVGAPVIYAVYNESSAVTILENTYTDVIINFSVYTPLGSEFLNHSTALVNLSRSGQEVRTSHDCSAYQVSGDYANYTCNVSMWWWDNSSIGWAINAYIKDNSSTPSVNTTVVQAVGTTRAFVGGPTPLTWAGVSPGSKNQTASNDPYLMNNTGNVYIPSAYLRVNATHLRGEEDDSQGIWAQNFSVHWNNGGSPPLECGGTVMDHGVFTSISGSNLSAGNYTVNNGMTGQEELYFCITDTLNNLSTQAYSTAQEGLWTVQIEIP